MEKGVKKIKHETQECSLLLGCHLSTSLGTGTSARTPACRPRTSKNESIQSSYAASSSDLGPTGSFHLLPMRIHTPAAAGEAGPASAIRSPGGPIPARGQTADSQTLGEQLRRLESVVYVKFPWPLVYTLHSDPNSLRSAPFSTHTHGEDISYTCNIVTVTFYIPPGSL